MGGPLWSPAPSLGLLASPALPFYALRRPWLAPHSGALHQANHRHGEKGYCQSAK